jgi:hypothetical protein
MAEAERAYRAALERDSGDRKVHYRLAQVLRGRGAEREAMEHLRESNDLDDAREKLAELYTRARQQNYTTNAAQCREFGRHCRLFGRTRQADCWDREAARRGASAGAVWLRRTSAPEKFPCRNSV